MSDLPYFLNLNSVCGFFGEHRFLSNFHVHGSNAWYNFVPMQTYIASRIFKNSPNLLTGNCFSSSENYYQFEKVRLIAAFDKDRNMDLEEITKRFVTCTPAESKKIIKEYVMTDEQVKIWNRIRVPVMFNAIRAKFNLPELADELLKTGNKYLEESLWWGDRYWGVQYTKMNENTPKTIKAEDGTLWEKQDGKNFLGRILMSVRTEKQIEKEGKEYV